MFLDLDNDTPPFDRPAHTLAYRAALSRNFRRRAWLAHPDGPPHGSHHKILTAPQCARLTTDVADLK